MLRCFDNELVKHYPRGEKLRGPSSIFLLADTIEWFESMAWN
jgi:hypothetical protein